MVGRSFACALCALTIAIPAAAQGEPVAPATPPPPLVSKGVYLIREYRNPTFAAVLSMVLPGGGQVYNDDLPKFLGAATGLVGAGTLFYLNTDPTLRIVAGTTFGVVWLWSVGDAYLAAAVYNRELERLSLP